MITIAQLSPSDRGRTVTYHRDFCDKEVGTLSSWNEHYVFVKFKGPNGESCLPEDVSFGLI